MTDVELTARRPLAEIQTSEPYVRLTKKQQLWVSTYIQNGVEHGNYDPTLATMMAYRCKNEKTARILGYQVMRKIGVVEVLNLHFRTEPLDAFLKVLDRAIANKKLSAAQIEALKLKCQLLGLDNRLPAVSDLKGGNSHTAVGVAETPQISSNPALRNKTHRGPGRYKKIPKKTVEKTAITNSKEFFDDL